MRAIFLATLLSMLISALLCGQDAQFRAEKKLVRIPVRTADAEGRPIAGLLAEDFVIDENGARLNAESVGQEEVPLDLALLLDVSHSMSASLRLLASTANEAMRAMRRGDRVAVYTFAGDVRLELPLTDYFEQVEACLEAIALGKSRPATALFKPVFEAAEYLQAASEPGRRRAILMVSDAEGYRAKSEKETLHALWEADASVYLLRTVEPKMVKALRYTSAAGFFPSANVPALVEKSGGETLALRDYGFGEMLRRVRAQYTVYYAPSGGAAKRKVAVTLSEEGKARWPGAKALGRKEYVLKP
jgi:VWFA-related protein